MNRYLEETHIPESMTKDKTNPDQKKTPKNEPPQ